MSVRRETYRAIAVGAIAMILCGAATLANAGSRVDHSDIVITKQIDMSTPKLHESVSVQASGVASRTESLAKGKSNPHTTTPQESVSFSFTKPSVEYWPQRPDGND